MLLVMRDPLIALACSRDHFHVGLLVAHGRPAVAHHRMIIGEYDANIRLHDRGHYEVRFSMRTLTRVRAPGWLSMCHCPPIAPARWRMLERPKPSRAYTSGRSRNPTPSSATASSQWAGSSVMVMRTVCGRACRTALLAASCAMRSSSCSCSGRRPVATPPPAKVRVTPPGTVERSEEHTSELQSHSDLV